MAEITRDALLVRRAQLADEEKLAWANLNAVLGAEQDVEYWLARLAEPEIPVGPIAPLPPANPSLMGSG